MWISLKSGCHHINHIILLHKEKVQLIKIQPTSIISSTLISEMLKCVRRWALVLALPPLLSSLCCCKSLAGVYILMQSTHTSLCMTEPQKYLDSSSPVTRILFQLKSRYLGLLGSREQECQSIKVLKNLQLLSFLHGLILANNLLVSWKNCKALCLCWSSSYTHFTEHWPPEKHPRRK